MPKVNLNPAFVASPPLPKDGKAKVDYFDAKFSGFLLEVRSTGTSTYYLRYQDNGGKTKQFRIGSPENMLLEEARNKAKTIKKQTVVGFDPRDVQKRLRAVPTFRDFVNNQYLPYAKSYKRSWEQDKTAIDDKMMRLWGHRKMNEFNAQDLIGFQNKLLEGGLKPGTVNRYMALVKYIFNLAERWEVIEKSPTRNVPRLEDNACKERFLTTEEMCRLLDALARCNRPAIPEIIEFLLLTGARRGEALGLCWKELDLDKGVWVLPAERNKTKKSKTIPLSREAMELLKKRRDNGSEYVFPNPETGKPIRHLFWTWDKIRKEAGLPEVRIHDLRHSYASLLVNSGRSLYEVQKLLGHTQLSTTQKYAHLAHDTLKQATEIVGQKVGGAKVKNGG
ncbi:MAG: site-specific integrase [Desulfovibrionales bacterium]|nr:MAG: site-specific integrase [Desulfovibrionales bacterium]